MQDIKRMLLGMLDTVLQATITPGELVAAMKRSRDNFKSRVLLDSVNPDGVRLTTMELTYPRCVHSEFMTHRTFARNSASSRAIPVSKMLERIEANPFVPLHWGKNQKGMQSWEELTLPDQLRAYALWSVAHYFAVNTAKALDMLKLHKQVTNRIVEPWMWITVIASACNWENFFALRCHKDAEPHMQVMAETTRMAYDASQPKELAWGLWHTPLVEDGRDDDVLRAHVKSDGTVLQKVATGRCARVSYLTHEGVRDLTEDVRLHDQLCAQVPLHASPFEHVAEAVDPRSAPRKIYTYGKYEEAKTDWGCFDPGWMQYRKFLPNENIRERLETVS